MTLRIINNGNALPFSLIVDPAAEFEAGMIGQNKQYGNNQVVCGVSDGRSPTFILDDFKTRSLSMAKIDEQVIVTPNPSIISGGMITLDVRANLEESNILADSFISRNIDIKLYPKNGVVEFIAGTRLNSDINGDGIADSIQTFCSYSFIISNIPGMDSTLGSGRVTAWAMRMWAATDIFETSTRYPINAPLFVSQAGKLTTQQVAEGYPAVGMVLSPPTSMSGSMLDFLWF